MDSLRCTNCRKNTQQFSILSCDHLVCPECLWGQITTTLQGNSFKCSCGQITNYLNQKNLLHSAKITAVGSPRNLSSHKNSSVNQSAVSTPKTQKAQFCKDWKREGQLSTQLQFLSIRYRKQLQQVQRNFKKILQSLQNKFQNLIKNVKMFWLQQIIQSQSLPLLDLPKLLEKKYHKFVGIRIQRINEVFLSQLNAFRLQTQPSTKIMADIPSRGISPSRKQNTGIISNCIEQRKKMLQFLLRGSEMGKVKKIGRKSDKLRYN